MLGDESDDSSDSDNFSPSGVSDASQHPGSREADSEGSFRSGSSKSNTSKQSTQSNTDWLVGRSWLRYSEEEGMTCVLCVKHKQRSYNHDSWTSQPCKRIRFLNDHALQPEPPDHHPIFPGQNPERGSTNY